MKFGYTYRGFLPYATFGTAGKSRISQILILSAAPNKIWFEVHDGFIGQRIFEAMKAEKLAIRPLLAELPIHREYAHGQAVINKHKS